MTKKLATFLVFLCLNLGAAYAPAMLCVPGLPGSTSVGWKFLFYPVFFAMLMVDATNPDVAWCVLVHVLVARRAGIGPPAPVFD